MTTESIKLHETPKQREQRQKRADKQKEEIGWVSLKNRKSPDEIYKAMVASGGLTSAVCKILECSPIEWRTLTSANKDIGIKWQEIKKQLVDKAESAMASLMDSPNEQIRFQASKFVLQTQGRQEGWGQDAVQQIEVTNGDTTTTIKQIFGIE